MKQRIIFTLTMPLAIASVLFFSCSKNSESLSLDKNGSIHESGTVPPIYAARITIEKNAFNPNDVTIMQNGTLLWTNSDSQVHTVTADDGSFERGDIQPGSSFSFTFTIIGPHTYHCKYHGEQTGVVKCVTK